uniref:Uncharacterized protein n=1 Tax=Arundo donax TaxID=35708 RepID=A0A0A9BMY3_ARUDO
MSSKHVRSSHPLFALKLIAKPTLGAYQCFQHLWSKMAAMVTSATS